MITAAQKAARAQGIGASDVPALFGLDPFRTSYDLWAVKTGRAESDDAGDAARIGSALERGILDLAEHELGARIVAPKGTIVRGALRVNVDGFVGESRKGAPIVEAKLTSWPEGWGRPGSAEIPDRVAMQVQAQMLACESSVAYVARLLVARRAEFALYSVSADPDLQAEIEHRVEEFWRVNVQGDTPPAATGPSPRIAAIMRRDPGKRVAIPLEIVEAERAAKQSLAAAEEAYEVAKARLLAALGDADGGDAPGFAIHYRLITKTGLDSEQLEARFPDVASQCRRTSSYRRLEVRATKGESR